ncbi:MAG: transposase [Pseudomonadota bacterium]
MPQFLDHFRPELSAFGARGGLVAGERFATAAGVSNATYYNWRKKFGSMGRSQLSELKALEKENQRLKKIVADLELDKLILK